MVPQIKKILYATDLTKNSAYVFYFAADLARKYDAKIVILHCVGLIDPYPLISYGGRSADAPTSLCKAAEREKDEHTIKLTKRLQAFLKEEEAQVGQSYADPVSETIITPGYAVEEILNTADAKRCDLIVLGTHGKGWLKQTFLGSTARSVLERTRKPMFIIPLPSDRPDLDWDAA